MAGLFCAALTVLIIGGGQVESGQLVVWSVQALLDEEGTS
jgi:hypothetical protein